MQEAAAIVSRALGRNDDVALISCAAVLFVHAGRRHARPDSRARRAIRRANHRLPRVVCHLRGAGSSIPSLDDLRLVPLPRRRRRASDRDHRPPAAGWVWDARLGQQPRADPLSHGGNGVAATRRGAGADHPEHARGARIGRLVTVFHCSSHFRDADLCRARECRGKPRAERRHFRAGGRCRSHRYARIREQLAAHHSQFARQRCP